MFLYHNYLFPPPPSCSFVVLSSLFFSCLIHPKNKFCLIVYPLKLMFLKIINYFIPVLNFINSALYIFAIEFLLLYHLSWYNFSLDVTPIIYSSYYYYPYFFSFSPTQFIYIYICLLLSLHWFIIYQNYHYEYCYIKLFFLVFYLYCFYVISSLHYYVALP